VFGSVIHRLDLLSFFLERGGGIPFREPSRFPLYLAAALVRCREDAAAIAAIRTFRGFVPGPAPFKL